MILVTGGTGLVGSHLLYDLAKSGEKIRALRRRNSHVEQVRKVFSYYSVEAERLFAKIEWVEGELLDYQSVLDAMEGIDEVYHCAAFVSFNKRDRLEVLRNNIEGTANMVNAALEQKVRKLGFVSSIAALGRPLSGEDITEELIWRPSRHTSAYSESKFKSEMEVWRGIAEGLNAVIINPSVIIGPGMWNRGSGLFFKNIWKGLRYYTLGVNGYVDVRDVVLALTSLMKTEISGERFIVSSENLSVQDIFGMIARHLGKAPPSRYASPAMMSFVQKLDALKSALFFTAPALPKETLHSAHQQVRYSNHKIRQALGMEFIPMEKSVMETARQFLKDVQR